MKPLFLLSLLFSLATAQRFLREGGQMDNDFKAENALDEDESLSGMTREMFLMQDMSWELQPPVLDDNAPIDGATKKHIQRYCSAPIQLKLTKRKGKFGLRAVGKMESGKKLRGFWRQGSGDATGAPKLKSSDFMTASYDDAVRSRLFMVDFEVQLPKMKNKVLPPSVVYSVAVEPGQMNSKAMVPRGAGRIKVYPKGHEPGSAPVVAGKCSVGISMRAGIVDPSWAKGRPIFRKGRPAGII
jgi:hypothetical protein